MTPEHLAVEFIALATEVIKNRRLQGSANASNHPRKKRRTNPLPAEALHGSLTGVTIYIMRQSSEFYGRHAIDGPADCKDDLDGLCDQPINQVIASQVRALVDSKGLGADVLALEQGTRICALDQTTRLLFLLTSEAVI